MAGISTFRVGKKTYAIIGSGGEIVITDTTDTVLNGVLMGNGSNVIARPIDNIPMVGSQGFVTSGGIASSESNLRSLLADEENIYTTSAHAVGSILVVNTPSAHVPAGLYRAITAIQPGEYLSVGNNIEPTTINDVKAGVSLSFTVTLDAADWSSGEQTVSSQYFVASGYAYITSPASARFADYVDAQIYADDVSTNGSMTFHCVNEPTNDITVKILRTEAST